MSSPLRILRSAWASPSAAWLTGSLLPAPLVVWLVGGAGFDVFRNTGLNVHDAQAQAFLHGNLSVAPGSLSFEAFVIDGRQYSYFGPVPALFRMPILWAEPNLVGRLTGISMILAWVALAFAGALMVRSVTTCAIAAAPAKGPSGRAYVVMAGITGMSFSGGSALMFALASPNHYHESLLWGLATSVLAMACIVRWYHHSSWRTLVAAVLAVTVAVHTRATVGLGLCLALVGSAALIPIRAWLDERAGAGAGAGAGSGSGSGPGTDEPMQAEHTPAKRRVAVTEFTTRVATIAATVVAAIPLVSSVVVNFLKFKMLFGLPMSSQLFSSVDPRRIEMLKVNDGRYFRPSFVPTNFVQYVRPDAFGFSKSFPFATIPQRRPWLIGSPFLDHIEPTSSIWGAFPVVALAAVLGLVALMRRRPSSSGVRTDSRPLGILRRLIEPSAPQLAAILTLAGIVGAAGVLTIGFIGNRYLIDFAPLMLVLAMYAWWSAIRRHVRIGRGLVVAAVVVAVLGGAANLSVAISEVAITHNTDVLSRFVTLSLRFTDKIGGREPSVVRSDVLPPQGSPGDLWIVGDCRALYRSDGSKSSTFDPTNWRVVRRSTSFGEWRGTIQTDDLSEVPTVEELRDALRHGGAGAKGTDQPTAVLSGTVLNDGDQLFDLYLAKASASSAAVKFVMVRGDTLVESDEFDAAGDPHSLMVVADPALDYVELTVDQQSLLYENLDIGSITRVPDATNWYATTTWERADMSVCHRAASLTR